MNRTPLYEIHKRHGGKLVEFAGWEMPIQYSGIIKEVKTVREKAGLFDVSHMGKISVRGNAAEEYLQHLLPNNISKLEKGKVLYSPMCYENGGIVDDLLVYRIAGEDYMLVVNASNTEKDFKWMMKIKEDLKIDAEIENTSGRWAQLALQGPLSQRILQNLVSLDLTEIKYFRFGETDVNGAQFIVSRTGYTGEDGFEIYLPSEKAEGLWDAIISAGKGEVLPVGLGARDVLRLEAGMMLYGSDIDDTTTPLEAPLAWTVKLGKKEDFIGKSALLRQKEEGVKKHLIGFEVLKKAVPRHGHPITSRGNEIGAVTSGTFSPTLGKPIGMGYVSEERDEMEILIREKPFRVKLTPLPFYKRREKHGL